MGIPHLLRELFADARGALRQMRRDPAFTVIAVLTVGLGIGATVALAAVANAVILRALPYADEARIHVFWSDELWRGDEFDFLAERRGVFSDLAVYSTDGEPYVVDARSGEGARLLRYVVATPSLFDVLGVRPALGPGFSAADALPHAAPVVVVSHEMWRDELGGDARVLGRRILVGGQAVTVVGVMPEGFFFPTPEIRAWRPLRLDPADPMYGTAYLTLIGRTPSGLAPARIDADVRRMARELGQRFAYPRAWDKTRNPHVTSIHAYLLGDARGPILLLLVAVVLLLVIAAANTAALVLARASDRGPEMAVRAALGAGGGRLVRQLGAEALVLALAASCLGAGVATAGFRLLVARLPLSNGMAATVTPGVAVPAVAFALALGIASVLAIAPARALLGRRFDPTLTRERGEAGLRRGTQRAHAAILAAQVTFAVLLAAGAALLVRSVNRIRALDPGFDPRGVATFTVVTRGEVPNEVSAQYLRDLTERVGALPGVSAAGTINRLPVRDLGYESVVSVEGRPDLAGANGPTALYRIVSPGLLRALGMRIVAGRDLEATDRERALPVTLVSESFARAMWPGQSAVGKHVGDGWTGTVVSREVVGVVGGARLTKLTGDAPYAILVPFEQAHEHAGGAVLAVRSTLPMARLVPQVRRVAAELDPLVAVTRAESMESVVARSLAEPLRLRFFLGLFAALAVLLCAVGVYGTVRYAVTRRRAELGLRMALGATPGRVVSGVLRRALAPVALGALLGLGGALSVSRLLAGFLYGVSTGDAASLAAAAGTLLVAALLAALVPALEASRASPATTLRAE